MKTLKKIILLHAFASTISVSHASYLDSVQNLIQGAVKTYGESGKGALIAGLQQGVGNYTKTGNLADAGKSVLTGTQKGFEKLNLRPQVEKTLPDFFKLNSTTDAQKRALLIMVNNQQYQDILTVIDQTNDVYKMLSKTPDNVKAQNEEMLKQMGDALNNIDAENIVLVTKKIHDFVVTIAPKGTSAYFESTNITKDSLEATIIDIVEKKYGTLFKWVQDQIDLNEKMQAQRANNPFFQGGSNTQQSLNQNQSSNDNSKNNAFMSSR